MCQIHHLRHQPQKSVQKKRKSYSTATNVVSSGTDELIPSGIGYTNDCDVSTKHFTILPWNERQRESPSIKSVFQSDWSFSL